MMKILLDKHVHGQRQKQTKWFQYSPKQAPRVRNNILTVELHTPLMPYIIRHCQNIKSLNPDKVVWEEPNKEEIVLKHNVKIGFFHTSLKLKWLR